MLDPPSKYACVSGEASTGTKKYKSNPMLQMPLPNLLTFHSSDANMMIMTSVVMITEKSVGIYPTVNAFYTHNLFSIKKISTADQRKGG
jgi:hypothetical protein